ncbi:WD40/YVTN/BNR-like repeat-containing protein [Arsukibacterium sp.]|uniref:WD40/YVTN/BNR-like repeat-containing protein n=1 Tax=Arsukibacterium sp. TaxID=1977258 RepID=UPI002FDB4016
MRKSHLTLSSVCLLLPMILLADTEQPTVSEHPQAKAAYMVPLAQHSLLTDVFKVSDNFFAVVGERGHILTSQDAVNWQQATVPSQSNLTALYFIDRERGWAVGHDASILATTDAGVSWHLQQFKPETDKPLLDIYFRNAQQGIAIGAYGMFYQTEDGGQHWHKVFHLDLVSEDDKEFLEELAETDPESYQLETESVLPHFNRLLADGKTLYIVGESGFIAKSNDFGESWQLLEAFYNGSLFDIHRTPEMSLLAVGLRGHAFRSTDNGLSWSEISLPVNATLNSVFSDQQGRIYITGNAGTLLISSDDGQSFQDGSLSDGLAILNGTVLANQLLLVTEAGVSIQPISKSK